MDKKLTETSNFEGNLNSCMHFFLLFHDAGEDQDAGRRAHEDKLVARTSREVAGDRKGDEGAHRQVHTADTTAHRD
jgi:hypothetical protein